MRSPAAEAGVLPFDEWRVAAMCPVGLVKLRKRAPRGSELMKIRPRTMRLKAHICHGIGFRAILSRSVGSVSMGSYGRWTKYSNPMRR